MTVRIRAPLDDYARQVVARSPNMAIAWWLMDSYVYYHADGMIITDGYFDELSRDMLARWDSLTHPHKHLVDAEALRAGTGFHLSERDYPERLVAAAALLLERGALEVYEGLAPSLMTRCGEVETPTADPPRPPKQLEMF